MVYMLIVFLLALMMLPFSIMYALVHVALSAQTRNRRLGCSLMVAKDWLYGQLIKIDSTPDDIKR